jgi:hypothetical protein
MKELLSTSLSRPSSHSKSLRQLIRARTPKLDVLSHILVCWPGCEMVEKENPRAGPRCGLLSLKRQPTSLDRSQIFVYREIRETR